MSKIQQTIIYSEGTCGNAAETNEPAQKSLTGATDSNYFAEIKGEVPSIPSLTCDGEYALLTDDLTRLSCELCENVCVKTLELSADEEAKFCSTQSQKVQISATLKKEYSGSPCYVKIKLVPSESQGDLTEAYVLLKATEGSTELAPKNVILNSGTWSAKANFKEETSSS